MTHEFLHANRTIREMIVAGLAAYAIHIECKRNYFRKVFILKSDRGVISVRASELVGHVEVVGLVLCCKVVEKYCPDGVHGDYVGHQFALGVGDVVAASQTQSFEAYTDYDPLNRLSSILTIRQSFQIEEGPMMVETDDEKIVVTLSKVDYSRYVDLKADPALGPLLANQVVIPAMLEVLHEMRGLSDDDFELDMQKRWFRSVYKKVRDLGIDIRATEKQPLEILQILLRLPLRRSLEGLIQINPLEQQS